MNGCTTNLLVRFRPEREDIYTRGGNGKSSKGILWHCTCAASGRGRAVFPCQSQDPMCYNFSMKRIFLIVLLLLPALAYAAPSIKFANDTHDFGKVREGEKLEYAFEFANSGTEELRIERVNTS